MKTKFSMLIALVLVLTLGLVTAVPVGAAEPATLLSVSATEDWGTADTIIVEVPAGTTLGQIDSILWSAYLIEGYPPHVDIMLDLDNDVGPPFEGLPDGEADEALVFEYAVNNSSATGEPVPSYGATHGVWFQTFKDDETGLPVVDGTASAWLATGEPGGEPAGTPIAYNATSGQFVLGTLAEWQAGLVVPEINADTIVLRLEIEIDNYILVGGHPVDHSSLVNDIVLVIAGATVPVGMTASSPGEIIGVSVSPTSVEFGSLVPGTVSADMEVTVTNEGNVAVDLDVTIENELPADFYTDNLTIAGSAVSAWERAGVLPAVNGTPAGTAVASPLVLAMPRGTPAGDYTATLVFWAIATSP